MPSIKASLAVILLSGLLVACGGTGGQRGDDLDGADDFDPLAQDGADAGLDDDPFADEQTGCQSPPCEFARDAINDPDSRLAARLIFFDFDRSTIKAEYQALLEAHGKYLAEYPDMKVRLEGHTDERGSREYNLALGEQRAKAVRQVLLFQGVSEDNISVVSFGEELPMDLGHDESAWSQNRRVELVYEAN